jgi:hypothetical protein
MSPEHPSGPFPAPEPRRLEIRPIGGLQELREVLTAARLADLATRDGAGEPATLPSGLLTGLLAELEAPAVPPPTSLFTRAWRAVSGRSSREARARAARLVSRLRELAIERERFESSFGSHLERLAGRLEEIERAQAELSEATRRLASELADRRRPALGDPPSP